MDEINIKHTAHQGKHQYRWNPQNASSKHITEHTQIIDIQRIIQCTIIAIFKRINFLFVYEYLLFLVYRLTLNVNGQLFFV